MEKESVRPVDRTRPGPDRVGGRGHGGRRHGHDRGRRRSPADDFGAPGPYATAVEVGAITTLYYPRDIADSDRRHPVIVWGNGTGGVPLVYRT